MALNGIWIDPSDDNVVTVDSSPENVVTAITDKSVSGNDVSTVNPTLLANFDGSDGISSPPGYTSQDVGARVPTFFGNAQLDTAQSKFGASSLNCDGTGDYISFPNSTDFQFGAGDFTIEFWVRWSADPGTGIEWIMGFWDATASDRSWAIAVQTNQLRFANSANGTNVTNDNQAFNPAASTWYHIAIVRSFGQIYHFIDGVQSGTEIANATTFHASAHELDIGSLLQAAGRVPAEDFTGWIDDLRIIKGTALMPPASAFDLQPKRLLEFDDVSSMTKVPKVIGDFIANFDGVDGRAGSPEYISEDAGARLATFFGTAQIDTAQSRFGASSLLCDGNSDYVTFPDSTDWDFGSGDFTIECWVRHNDASNIEYFVNHYNSQINEASWAFGYDGTTNNLKFLTSDLGTTVVTLTSSSYTATTGVWIHYAACRVGGNLRMYADGVEYFGALRGGAGVIHHVDGWIDDVRVIKGTGLYTADFDPPATAHPTDPFQDMDGPDFEVFAVIGDNSRQESEVVLDFEGTDGDTSYTSDDSSERTATFFGDAELDDAQKRFGSTSLLCPTAGSPVSYMSLPDSADFTITGDFTMECWVRFAGTPGVTDEHCFAAHWNSNGVNQRGFIFWLRDQVLTFHTSSNGTASVENQLGAWTPSSATWYHVAVVRSGTVLKGYVDGVENGTATLSGSLHNSTEPMTFGDYEGGAGFGISHMEGWIDGFRFVNGVALHPDEVVLGVTGDASPLDETGWRITRPSMNTVKFSVGDEATNFVTLDTPQDNENIILSMAYDSTVGYIEARINGDVSDSIAYTGTPGFAYDFVMGEKRGDILETVYVDRLLGSLDRQRTEGYLAHKWAIASILPVGHPFKDAAPDIVVDAEFVANFNGADAATSYTAETGQAATFFGTAQLDDAQQKFGALESPVGTSLLLDGNSDYATFPDSADWDFGNGDFTVECWVRFNGAPTASMMFAAHWDSDGDNRAWYFGFATTVSPTVLIFQATPDGTQGSVVDNREAWNPDGDVWYHLAVVRRRDELLFFVDGIQLGTAKTLAITINNPAEPLWIGALDIFLSISSYMDGWIDSVRIIKGTALYKYDFTPPLREFQIPPTNDVFLLANFNGQDGVSSPPGYVTEDTRAREAIWTGTAQLDTAQKKFGLSSLLLDGNSDYIEYPNIGSPNTDLGITIAASKTVEFWVRPGAGSIGSPTGAQKELMNKGGTVGLYWSNWRIALRATGEVSAQIYQSGGAIITVDSTDFLTLETWHHVAFTWDVSVSPRVMELFIDGVSQGTGSSTIAPFDVPATQPGLVFGHQISSTNDYFPGHFDGFRMSEGILYTADFDPPTAPPSTEFNV
jgi:hypothetical protein